MSIFNKVITKVFGKKSDKDIKKLTPIVDEINIQYDKFKELSETAKAAATMYFLRGLMSLQNEATTAKNRYPISIPPSSVNKKNVSLIDASILKVFFGKYNDYVNNESISKLNKVKELKAGEPMEILIKKACGE